VSGASRQGRPFNRPASCLWRNAREPWPVLNKQQCAREV